MTTRQWAISVTGALLLSHLQCYLALEIRSEVSSTAAADGSTTNLGLLVDEEVISSLNQHRGLRERYSSQYLNFDRSLQPQNDPPVVSGRCQADTANLLNLIGVNQATASIIQWAETRQFDDICVEQNDKKTTCVLDFNTYMTAAMQQQQDDNDNDDNTSMETACYDAGAIYVDTEFVFRCTVPGVDFQLFYSVLQIPSCSGYSCGEDGTYAIQEQSAETIRRDLEDQTGLECARLRLEFSRLTIPPEEAPRNCDDDTNAIMDLFQQENATTTDHSSSSSSGITMNSVINPLSDNCLVVDDQDGVPNWSCNVDFADYNTAASTLETCNDINGGMYLEADYTLSCDHKLTSETMTLVTTNHPLCVSTTFCVPEDFGGLASRYARSLIEESIEIEGWSCEMDGTPFVQDFPPTQAPTITAAPTKTVSPSASPSSSPAPTRSPEPTTSPTEMKCLDSSILLSPQQVVESQVLGGGQSGVSFFDTYCIDGTGGTATCEMDYANFPTITSNIKSTCVGEGGQQDDTINGNGVYYVEDMITLICKDYDNDDRETHITLMNRPSCRSDKCNGSQLKEVDAYELEWFIMDYLLDDNTMDCDIDRVQVAIGGVEEYGTPSDFLPEFCSTATSILDTTSAIFNQKQMMRDDFEDYMMTSINSDGFGDVSSCSWSSAINNDYECDIDFASSSSSLSTHGAGVGPLCVVNGGTYVEISFLTECHNSNIFRQQPQQQQISILSENVPSCLGDRCSAAQGLQALKGDAAWVAILYENKGWTCTTTMRDVYPLIVDLSVMDEASSQSVDDLDDLRPNFGSLWGNVPLTPDTTDSRPTTNVIEPTPPPATDTTPGNGSETGGEESSGNIVGHSWVLWGGSLGCSTLLTVVLLLGIELP